MLSAIHSHAMSAIHSHAISVIHSHAISAIHSHATSAIHSNTSHIYELPSDGHLFYCCREVSNATYNYMSITHIHGKYGRTGTQHYVR